MQKDKTLKFWDDFYENEAAGENNHKEWILQPSKTILQSIADHLPDCGNDINCAGILAPRSHSILEIGCGNSSFSRNLWQHLQERVDVDGKIRTVDVIATDVSSVCIEQNINRDESCIIRTPDSRGESDSGSFRYHVLNVLDISSVCQIGKHDIILDKGCFDTFLFRSGKKKYGQSSPLVESLLNNIHILLKENGKYIIFSPRKKINDVRDFMGFSSVERIKFDSDGLLDRKAVKNDVVYMHVCMKDKTYVRVEGKASFCNQIEIPPDDRKFGNCGVKFFDFRNGVLMRKKECMITWARKFHGHVQHCKSKM